MPVDPKIESWAGAVVNSANMDACTIGVGSSFPATWDTSRIFWRTDEQKLYQNVGTEGTPDWSLVGSPALGKKKFTTAGDTLTPETQSGLLQVTIDASLVTAGNITMTVDGTDTVYSFGTASTTFWSEPTSSISIEAKSEGYHNAGGSPTITGDQPSGGNADGLTVASDGMNLYSKNGTTVKQWILATKNDIDSYTSNSNTFDLGTGANEDIQISADGTKFYYIDTTGYIRQRNFSTAYDITTLGAVVGSHTLDAGITYPKGLDITDDGIHAYVTNSQDNSSFPAKVYYGTMSTAWDITTLTMTLSWTIAVNRGYKVRGMSMSNDGSVMWYSSWDLGKVYRWNPSTDFDPSTNVENSNFINTSTDGHGTESQVKAFTTSSDGTVSWKSGDLQDRITQLDTAVDYAGTGYARVL